MNPRTGVRRRNILALGVLALAGGLIAWAPETAPPPSLDPKPGSGRSSDPGLRSDQAAGRPDPLAAELDRRLSESVAPLLDTYCFECHARGKSKGGVHLDRIRSVRDASPDDLDRAREMIATRQMPPDDEAQPSDHERLILQQWFDAALDYVPPDATLDPGWFTIHRLNRTEYRNTLRDLLGIDPSQEDIAARLPRDDSGYGFDNIADVLTTSPLAIEAYLDAAERAIELGLGPELAFGDAPRRLTPLEAGNGRPLPGGGHFLFSNGAVSTRFLAPATGEYLLRLRAWETHAGEENSRLSIRLDGREIRALEVSGTREEPEHFEIRARIDAGEHRVAAAFTNDYYVANVADRNLAIEWITLAGPLDESTTQRPAAWTRIFEQPLANAGIAPGADERTRAARILADFASRAYRRPAMPDEEAELSARFQAVRSQSPSFESAVRLVLTAILVSPNFLFRSVANPDTEDPSTIYRLGGYEIASRLSYFLWSSMPDDRLLAAAGDGSLERPESLAAEAQRLLADLKADAFIQGFSSQWLELRALGTLAIDTSRFPEYDADLRAAMELEAVMFFGDIVRNDRSVLELLDSDHTFLNERLARFYAIEGVRGPNFRPVALPPDSPRGGVLTMGAVLTVTSNTTRTSPVKRGLFVLDQLLGSPPPPPPADIPPLDQAAISPDATLRQRLAAHVANPTCAVCHNRLDPLGLALENFDAIGRWREQDSGQPIDASGVLPGGTSFNGPNELKKVLASRADEFVETLSAKVLTYALGRGPEPFDRPTVGGIARATRAGNDRFDAMIRAIVLSDAFRTCRGRPRLQPANPGDEGVAQTPSSDADLVPLHDGADHE